MEPIIQTINLSKEYHLKGRNKKILALNNVNLEIYNGEKFGLLGPNGAGKTTLISLLNMIIQPTRGYAIIKGYNIIKHPNKVKQHIGLMLGSEMIYYRITGYQNLKFFAKIYEIPNYEQKIEEIAQKLEIENWMNEYVERYSTGMKTKLCIAKMLLINPEILFLDEPTLGLDVSTTNFILKKLQELEKTVILSTHNMSFVEKLCDRIAFINKGEIIKIGTKRDLQLIFQKGISIFIEISEKEELLLKNLLKQDFIKDCRKEKSGLVLTLRNREDYSKLFNILQIYHVTKIEELSLSIEDLFLKLV
jgi:ABC-2 type transport system ATP-binding protein